MDLVGYTILIPLVAGAVVRLIPDALKGVKEGIALIVSALTFYFTIALFRQGFLESGYFGKELFRMDTLSSFVLLFIGFFGLAMVLYSLGFMRNKPNLKQYYSYWLLTLGGACGAVLANDMILFMTFWGFLGFTLYMLVMTGGPKAAGAAKKTMVIVGGTDALLVLAVAIVWVMTGSTSMTQESIPTVTGLSAFAFILFACAAFAKAGAMPFHSWIPDTAEHAPTSVVAYLPASVDKLLGIYLLARVSLYLFNLTPGMQLLVLIVGAFTIIAAVMMALVQHDLKRLLSYHAVSQVGYMVLGVATLNPIGVAGGLFHMVNHAIYKGCLFLCAGSVENEEGTTDLDSLGGLARYMPITFVSCVLAALAISGIPPLNGFVSKWMVYQGIIEMGRTGGYLWVLWLVAAMFGSALTLASFMKVLHAVFLGIRGRQGGPAPKEAGIWMTIPMLVLAALCLAFGIFAFAVPLSGFILPAINGVSWLSVPDVSLWLGWWNPGMATLLIVVGVIFGLVIYTAGRLKGTRSSSMYVGGELLTPDERVTGTDFYTTVSDMGFFRTIYKWAEARAFDTYDIGRSISFYFIKGFRAAHTGILPEYLTWSLAGLLVLVILLLR
jgi:formate hydrogenlyase subunit 3/multisubunit Na+/H+ antiporter MnhD subunit